MGLNAASVEAKRISAIDLGGSRKPISLLISESKAAVLGSCMDGGGRMCRRQRHFSNGDESERQHCPGKPSLCSGNVFRLHALHATSIIGDKKVKWWGW